MNKRIGYIDFLRGLALINMVIYHTLYDLKYIFNANMSWFSMDKWYYYQQYICISFIFLSGFSSFYSKKLLKNGIKLLIISMIITLITSSVSKDLAIYFGVLHFLSFSMIIIWLYKFINFKNSKIMGGNNKNNNKYAPNYEEQEDKKKNIDLAKIRIQENKIATNMEKSELKEYQKNKKVSYRNNLYFLILLLIFIFIRSDFFLKNDIYLKMYHSLENLPFSFIMGFPKQDFYSSDYFPIIPWIFLSFVGYYFANTKYDIGLSKFYNSINKNFVFNFLQFLGRHSLIIYVFHQVVIYGILSIIYNFLF